MKNIVETPLSWFTILLAAFYSLLASCRGHECGQENLLKCARPLGKITNNNNLGFVTTKSELQALCPDLQSSMKCINSYTKNCMPENQRQNFNSLYQGVNIAIKELCQDGSYQDAFLKHAPCMQKVQTDYELCSKRYQQSVIELESKNTTKSSENVKSVCCAFREFLACSHHTVRRKCGEETAEFTKDFLDRMSNSLIKMHCSLYTQSECIVSGAATTSQVRIITQLTTVLLLASHYLFT
ncbi:GSCOCG00000702001-RA-CDS [Cotesia congregata]|uniref:uncharacterized protein LOC123264962 n=1 Tax=Cotesia glomerata TaxID=32391 RepID=UPI0017614BC3|nr:uncharacterized protein LOC123264962 [Cotesia glomerata]CAD6215886.1 GSCOCG00000702001-RA-CDS [Cotesia congregata]